MNTGRRLSAPRSRVARPYNPFSPVRINLMAPVVPNPKKIKSFQSEAAFEAWLRANHARETEIWLQDLQEGLRQADGHLRAGAGRRAVLGLD